MSNKGKSSKSKQPVVSDSSSGSDSNEEKAVPTKGGKGKQPVVVAKGKQSAVATKGGKDKPEPKSDSKTVNNLRYRDVKVEDIVLEEAPKSDGPQTIWFMNHNNTVLKQKSMIRIQTGKIIMTGGGIPELDEVREKRKQKTYGTYMSDKDREFIKIPLDPKQKPCVELAKFMTMLDDHYGSEEFRKEHFGDKWQQYLYQPCVREPQEEENKEATQSKYPKLDTCKMKFDTERESHANRTKLVKNVDGVKTRVVANTITEITKEIKFKTTCKFLFSFAKLWAQKLPAKKGAPKDYGIGFKIQAIEYTPGESGGFGGDAEFDSNSDEDEDDEVETKPKSKTPPAKSNAKPNAKAAKLDSDDDSGSDKSEEVPAKKPVGKKPTKPAESESGSDSDEPPKGKAPAKKPAGKKPAESDSGSADDSDEPPKGKAPAKKPAGKKPAESESGSDSDEPPKGKTPAKKPAGKKPAESESGSDDDSAEIPVKKTPAKKKPVKK